ncbi:MAG: serine hydrolase [Akkermansiaceae bacterium]|nr:serine hydrolase [Armatimonadota bacterium]
MIRSLLFGGITALLCLASLPTIAYSASKLFDFKDPKEMNAVSLSIDAPWEPVVGYADGISGTARFDPARPGATTGRIVADVSSVKFSHPGYTQTARFYALEEKKFPQVVCELKKIQTIQTVRPGVYTGTVAIDFTCHGVTRAMTVPISVTHLPGVAKQRYPDFDGDLLVVRCNFVIRRADFGIAKGVPNNEVAEEVGVRVAIVGTEKNRAADTPPAKKEPGKAAVTTPATSNIPVTLDGKTYSLAERMAFHKVPGVSVAVIKNFGVAWVGHYGEAAKGKPVGEETRYMAGAMGQVLVAAAALKASESGQIALDAPIDTLLRSWKVPASPLLDPARPITVRDLLMHRSGFTYDKYEGYAPGAVIPNITDVLVGAKPAQTPPAVVAVSPGTTFDMAMENYAVLQQIAEDRTERPFDDLMRDLILAPLGMKNSAFTIPSRDVAAVGHTESGDPLPGGWREYPERAASGLWTTASDFAGGLAELLRGVAGKGGTYLKPETAKLLVAPIPEATKSPQAIGFGIDSREGIPYLYRGGNTEGYFCHLDADPEQGNAVIVFTNGNLCWRLTNEIRDSIARSEGFRGYASEGTP